MALDLTNKKLGRLTVLERSPIRNARNAMWLCRCDCGSEVTVAAANIGRSTNSCGCIAKEYQATALNGNTYQRTHNSSQTLEYKTWSTMKQRCTNPNLEKFKDYGARGIVVCDRWLDSFENFFEDMGPKPSKRHSIDRKENDGPYSKDNCHWALPIVQGRNSRRNHIVEIDGQRRCISEWVEFLKVPKWKPGQMLRKRGRNRDKPADYQTIEEALTALYFKTEVA